MREKHRDQETDTQPLRKGSYPRVLSWSLSLVLCQKGTEIPGQRRWHWGKKRELRPSVCTASHPLESCRAPRAPSGHPDPRAPRTPRAPARPTRTHLGSCCPRWRRAHSARAAGRTAARGEEPCGRAGTRAGRAPSPELRAASETGARSGLRPASASSAASRLAASSRPIPAPRAAPPSGPLAPGARGCRRESGAADAPAPPPPTAGGSIRQRLDAPGRCGSRASGPRGGPGVGTLAGRGRARVGAGGSERPWAGRRARIGSATRSPSWDFGLPGRVSPQAHGLPGSDGPYFPRLLRPTTLYLTAGPSFQSSWADGMSHCLWMALW